MVRQTHSGFFTGGSSAIVCVSEQSGDTAAWSPNQVALHLQSFVSHFSFQCVQLCQGCPSLTLLVFEFLFDENCCFSCDLIAIMALMLAASSVVVGAADGVTYRAHDRSLSRVFCASRCSKSLRSWSSLCLEPICPISALVCSSGLKIECGNKKVE